MWLLICLGLNRPFCYFSIFPCSSSFFAFLWIEVFLYYGYYILYIDINEVKEFCKSQVITPGGDASNHILITPLVARWRLFCCGWVKTPHLPLPTLDIVCPQQYSCCQFFKAVWLPSASLCHPQKDRLHREPPSSCYSLPIKVLCRCLWLAELGWYTCP